MPLSTNDKTNETAAALVKTLQGAFHTPPGFRPAHARGILLNGTFTPTPEAGSLSSAPHFNASSTPIVVRFSNSTGIPQIPDNAGDANPRGIAVRFVLPEKNGRRQHTDIIAHSTPFFPVRTGEDFLELLGAIGASAAPDAPKPSPIEVYLGKTPSAAAFVGAPKPTPASFATEKYFGVNAFKLVSSDSKGTFVRYRITPDAGESHLTDEEAKLKDPAFLHNEIQTRIIDGGASFTLWAQVAEEGDPTNDATIHWPESRKLVKLGSIKLETVADDNDEKQRTIIFDPVPRVEGVEASDDPIIDMRASVYLISGRERRAAGPHQ
ncbi:catalase [Cladophialophora psammophila CBS 110553]|uniref:Catalase n=1 Tax=Cladophialophora psammophila CBS 110553 TaxID=1182543 RepID=W9WZ54_9EURO|nr:catalase [Cladophialophora psammophila CBS 110553]EXJ69946.1 catalase [Cladophialophora psammophila CBS 110553]